MTLAAQGHKMDASTQIYGIIGNPVKHSLSPKIHNAEFQRLGINAAYLPFEVGKDMLGLAFEGIRSLGIRGVNITIPFKEEAVDHVDEIPEDLDRGIGALNTIVNRDGVLYGYNTDVPGFLWDRTPAQKPPRAPLRPRPKRAPSCPRA
jgi:shikimate dehydrogenase